MVARNTDADSAPTANPTHAAHRFLRWWQAWLSRLGQAAESLVDALRDRTFSQRHPGIKYRGILTMGVAALCVGALGGVLLSTPETSRTSALVAAVMSIAWAAIRLILMRLATSGDSTPTATTLWRAWALGLLPWALGVTPELRALAWGLSGAVTWLALARSGTSKHQALRCVGFAWGAQAAVLAGSWLARNALMVVLLSRN